MRAASRALDLVGSIALFLAVLLASPGVRVSHAEPDASYDPALERPASGSGDAPLARSVPLGPAGGATCGVDSEAGAAAAAMLPSRRGLQGMPLQIADGAEGDEGSSLNARGYNIGRTEPSADLQRMLFEASRRAH